MAWGRQRRGKAVSHERPADDIPSPTEMLDAGERKKRKA
jgi:hypothetical protein